MCGKICAGLPEFSSMYFSVKATLTVLTDFGCTENMERGLKKKFGCTVNTAVCGV